LFELVDVRPKLEHLFFELGVDRAFLGGIFARLADERLQLFVLFFDGS
jgi:hypothetical protein